MADPIRPATDFSHPLRASDIEAAKNAAHKMFGYLRGVHYWISEIAVDSPTFVARTFAALCEFQCELEKEGHTSVLTLRKVEGHLAGFRRRFPNANVCFEGNYVRPSTTAYIRELGEWMTRICQCADLDELLHQPPCHGVEPNWLANRVLEALRVPDGIEEHERHVLRDKPSWEALAWWIEGTFIHSKELVIASCKMSGCSAGQICELVSYFLDRPGEWTESDLEQRLFQATPDQPIHAGWPTPGLRSLLNDRKWLGNHARRIQISHDGQEIQKRLLRINFSLLDSELRGEFAAIQENAVVANSDTREEINRILADSEELFRSILRYSEARRTCWDSLSDDTKLSFFSTIFRFAFDLREIVDEFKPTEPLMDIAGGRDLFSRGVAIVRDVVWTLELQFPGGIGSVARVICPPYVYGKPVPTPAFRCYLSPLRMALQLMGSTLAHTPEAPWWGEPMKAGEFGPLEAIGYSDAGESENRKSDCETATAIDSSSPELDTPQEKPKKKHRFCELAKKAATAYKKDCDAQKKTLPISSWMVGFVARNAGVALWRKANAGTLTKKLQSHRDTWDPDKQYRSRSPD